MPSLDSLYSRNGNVLTSVREQTPESMINFQFHTQLKTVVEGPGRTNLRRIPKQETDRFLSKPRREGAGLDDFFVDYDMIVDPEAQHVCTGSQSVTG
jgi:hypothetical protein